MRLENKVAIITGASQGIGRQYALRFAKEGANVVIGDVRVEQATEVVKEIEALGRRALAVKTDVSSEEATQALADRTVERFGRIDVLVNNAALFYDLDMQIKSLEY